MAEFTRYVTADSLIRERSRDMGDHHMHRYGENLSLLMEGLRELDLSRFPVRGTQYRWLPVSNGRAQIPSTLSSVTRVGIDIGGHIQALRYNPNMVDRPGDCGELEEILPLNPDIPSLRSEGNVPIFYTGGVNGWLGVNLVYPGMNRNKSVHGYYKAFPAQGYILLDEESTYDFILVECIVPAMEPGTVTWVPELCSKYLTTYMRAKLTEFAAETDTKERPMVRETANDWKTERVKLNRRACYPPPAELWADLCLWG